MKTLNALKIAALSIAGLFALSYQTSAAVTVSNIGVKVYEIRASKSTDCSNPVTVFQASAPPYISLNNIASFGSGVVPHGVYHCLMFNIDDIVDVTSDTAEGGCVIGSNLVDIFSDPSNDVSITPEGTTIHANLGVEDRPWLYFSDSAQSAAGNNCFEPNFNGCACSGPCPLTPLSISVDQTRLLVMNLDGKVGNSGGNCRLLAIPAMTIR